MSVGAIDLGILAIYLAGVVALGLWIGRKAGTVSDYVVGGRDRPWWLILFSIVATETSTVTFLSIPGFAYSRDMTWLQIPLGFLLGRFVVVFLLLPQYFTGSFFTAYDVLHKRFGGATQRAASAMFIITRSLADGLRLFLSAIVLQEMTGIPLHWAVIVMGVATIVYTFFGGIRAVLVTDLVQFVIYIGGAIAALALIVHRLPGGWDQLLAVGEAAGKLRVFDLTFDWSQPYCLWAGLIGGLFITLGSHGVDQMMVQRYLCARNLKDAQRALWVGGFVVVAQFALFLLIGVGLFAFYQTFPPDAAVRAPRSRLRAVHPRRDPGRACWAFCWARFLPPPCPRSRARSTPAPPPPPTISCSPARRRRRRPKNSSGWFASSPWSSVASRSPSASRASG